MVSSAHYGAGESNGNCKGEEDHDSGIHAGAGTVTGRMKMIERSVLKLILENGIMPSAKIAERLSLHPEIAKAVCQGLWDDGLLDLQWKPPAQ